MRKYFNNVANKSGDAISGASVLVKNYPAGTTATIYSDEGVTPITNPIITDSLGYFEFYAADGRYSVQITGNQLDQEIILDIIIEDTLAFKANLANTADPAKGAALVGAAVKHVDSITTVNATGLPDGIVIIAKGRSASGDGGGGVFRYSAASVQSTDGGTVFAPSIGSGRLFRDGWTVLGFNGVVNVKWFGAKGDGITDDSSSVSNAIATKNSVYAPIGTYLINVSINNRTIIYGDGSTATIFKPFNIASAVFTYTYTAMSNPAPLSFWTYHSELRNIGLQSSGKTGVGFTFAKTDPAGYATNDEYANNVKFYGVNFSGFDKGVQFPFGNIGSEFYSCGFSANKYGVYSLDAKFGGLMHAGNKYFHGGEMHDNDCAIYLHNVTDGLYGLAFYGTVIENNRIGLYLYISPSVHTPITLDSVGFEGNGSAISGTTTIDAWTGSVKSTQVLNNKTIIIDGTGGKVNLNSGFTTDIWLRGSDIEVISTNSRCEGGTGFGGGALIVDNPDNSYIVLENPTSDGGWRSELAASYIPFVRGNMRDAGIILNPGSRATSRVFRTHQRGAKVTGYGPSRAMSASLTTVATTGAGSFNLTGTVVSDGRLYNQCNEFTRAAFSSSEFTALNSPNSAITTSAGWYVFTLDMKIVSGAGVQAYVWDRSTAQLAASIVCNSLGKWSTFAAIGYSDGGQTLYLDFSGLNGDVTWRISAYQIHRFDTLNEAQLFIASSVFAES